jgi:hypothetical protein
MYCITQQKYALVVFCAVLNLFLHVESITTAIISAGRMSSSMRI